MQYSQVLTESYTNVNYIIEKIGYVCNDKDKKSLSSCDAYYGDTSPIVQEYRNEGKPVMIMDYMV